MLYRPKNTHFIEAAQYKDFDSPLLKISKINAPGLCSGCNQPLSEHGMINNSLICPSSYIVYSGANIINILTEAQFNAAFEPIGEVVAEI